ncbi:hypothetical protein WH47_07505 [Habropoda laboriosa]|uniref:Uncharacterized protein n=1 Tax=Habropoda laboriosa TaxID=597456 RepID=A0A0L7RFY7_9HYME|nr:hypothetical protein WH47_07505 [Habropoda laboriosa]
MHANEYAFFSFPRETVVTDLHGKVLQSIVNQRGSVWITDKSPIVFVYFSSSFVLAGCIVSASHEATRNCNLVRVE